MNLLFREVFARGLHRDPARDADLRLVRRPVLTAEGYLPKGAS